ncbi:MAG: hypothetical protein ACRDD8_15900 [Bacteroidales bacterium]
MSYKFIVAKVQSTFEIPNADRVHGIIVLNEVLVAKKEITEGYVGVFAETDIQLSEEFCHENNLFRDKDKNKNNEVGGFFENSRRVRTQPFLGVKSSGFFFEKEMLGFTGADLNELTLGQEFDVLNGHNLCQKYVSEKQKQAMSNVAKAQDKIKACFVKGFEQHSQTAQFKHAVYSIPKGALLNFHAKVHGTSFRVGKHLVQQELSFGKKLVNKVFNREVFPTYDFDFVVGTRRVVLKDNKQAGFHGSEQFRYDILERLKPFLENGMTVYGEIAGYVNDNPIMGRHNVGILKNKEFTKKYGKEMVYSYGCEKGQYRFHIYRISHVVNGREIDMSARQIESFCESKGLLSHLNIHEPMIYDGNQEELVKLVDKLTERPEVLCEDYIDPTHVSEGIIIRVDMGTDVPKFFKSKSFPFKVMEGIFKENNVDVEDAN